MPEIIAIAALGKDTKFICADDKLLWNNPEDLKRVKEITMGHPLIMGRKTHDSINRPLPGRENIILTTNPDYKAEGCKVVHSVEEALEIAKKAPGGDSKIFIFGGSEIYKLFLDQTNKLMLTLVDDDKVGTHVFPDYEDDFEESEHHGSFEFDGHPYELIDFKRKTT